MIAKRNLKSLQQTPPDNNTHGGKVKGSRDGLHQKLFFNFTLKL